MTDEARFREALRDLPVPEHAPDFHRRREEALAQAPAAARRRLTPRRLFLAAAAVALITAALAVATSLVRTSSHSEGSPPAAAQQSPGGVIAGAAPLQVGDELTGMVRGLDGKLWAWGWRHREGPGSPLLEHWDGVSWREIALPRRRLTEISGVAAITRDDLWVAAQGRRGGLLLHWDGTTWDSFPTPHGFAGTSETSNALLAIGPDDVWAVAWGAGSDTATLHWDGSSWRPVPTPVPGRGGELWLRLVRGVSPGDVWALGDAEGYRPKRVNGRVLLHWSGGRWKAQPGPSGPASNGHRQQMAIDDIAVGGDGTLWAAGRRWFGPDNVGDLFVPVVLRLVAGRWEIMASGEAPSLPADWTRFSPRAIALSAPDDVWVAGSDDTHGRLWHWDGTAWQTIPMPQVRPPDRYRPVNLVAVSASEVWVLCQGGSMTGQRLDTLQPFFLRFDGVGWERVPAPQSADR
jgi:hypothetical protein